MVVEAILGVRLVLRLGLGVRGKETFMLGNKHVKVRDTGGPPPHNGRDTCAVAREPVSHNTRLILQRRTPYICTCNSAHLALRATPSSSPFLVPARTAGGSRLFLKARSLLLFLRSRRA